ncbi:MAG: very short patch repair endonuclease [Bacteroidetes bacterium]|nr:very short patch repair endonuclease [Bacteroidota bacterium]
MADYKFPDKISVPRFEEAAGFYTTPERSKLMSKIRGKNTAPERSFRKALWEAGVRYRLHRKDLPGKPDIANKKLRLAIFIDGAFWHGYLWEEKKGKIKSNKAFWIPKIERNMQRDTENTQRLERLGFTVFRFWEHDLKREMGACLKKILDHVEQAYLGI